MHPIQTPQRPANHRQQVSLNNEAREWLNSLPALYPKAAVMRAAIVLFQEHDWVRPLLRSFDPNEIVMTARYGANPFVVTMTPDMLSFFNLQSWDAMLYAIDNQGYKRLGLNDRGVTLLINQLATACVRVPQFQAKVLAKAQEPGVRSIPRGGFTKATLEKRRARYNQDVADYFASKASGGKEDGDAVE